MRPGPVPRRPCEPRSRAKRTARPAAAISRARARHFAWPRASRSTKRAPASSSGSTRRLSTTWRTATPSLRSAASSRRLSSSASSVGIVTTQNSARFSSCRMSDSWRICRWKVRRVSAAEDWPAASGAAAGFGGALRPPPSTAPKAAETPEMAEEAAESRWRRRRRRVTNRSRKSGKRRRRRVWPVGAVSMTMRSKRTPMAPSSRRLTTFASATSSSTPGGKVSSTSAKSASPSSPAMLSMSPRDPPSVAAASAPRRRTVSWKRRAAASGSTSMAQSRRWLASSTAVGVPSDTLRRMPSTSPRECAGSVDTMSVLWPASAALSASAAALLVFPTPPFPPTTTKRQLFVPASTIWPWAPASGGARKEAQWSPAKARSPKKRSG
mmetsp:Transcript_3238/g.10731  ORF Transcript_3238/g.10731 Transcript_3238/m.10731 type:complete len:382 (+) Transcript_3238:85-1230(+)